jgi:hypothetical protein
MRGPQTPEAYRDLLSTKAAAESIRRYEQLTESEVRSGALAVLESPVFRWTLVDLQNQAIQSIKITPPGPDFDRLCFLLAILETVLEAFIGQIVETRSPPDT